MSSNIAGGFFVELGLKTNKDSFEQGNKAIAGVGIGVTKLLGTVRNAVPLIAAGIAAINNSAAETVNVSGALGFSVKTYEAWGVAAKKAGVNAEGLYSNMKKLQGLKNEILYRGNTGAAGSLAQNLGFLGENDLKGLLELNPEQAVRRIFERATQVVNEGKKDFRSVAFDIGKILGSDFEEIFLKQYTEPDFNFFAWLDQATKDVYMDNATAEKALGFNREMEDLLSILQQISKYGGAEIASVFTPMIKALNDLLRNNKGEIRGTIRELAESLGIIGEAVKNIGGPALEASIKMITSLINALASLINGDWSKAGENIKNFFSSFEEGIDKIVSKYESVPLVKLLGMLLGSKEKASELFLSGWGTDGSTAPKGKKIKDGIVRPNGSVTQVAPDDWVFAARDVGKLAQAFIPRSFNTAVSNQGSQYTINQTINVSGSNDLAASVRQQAYRGTQDGLITAMAQGQQRLQLMPGLV